MEEHQHPFVSSPTAPRFPPPHSHRRNISRSPTRNRLSVTDDIFTDFSPTRILEAFINPTGRLKASIDAASQTDRTFGIRAAHASKNIQEWVRELEEWEWPTEGASLGFEVPPGKRRKLSNGGHTVQNGNREHFQEPVYIGSLPAPTVLEYESRIDRIHNELEDLHVEEIKRHVLETHFAPSRPSSSSSNASSSMLSNYTKMEDFTAIVTATVLKSLPNLSKLMHLMDIWGVRLSVLRKVPRLLHRLEEGEMALKSGWAAIQMRASSGQDNLDQEALTRETFEIMRNVLQDKVTTSGRDLDFMLDTLEGREDTLPDSWLDRMEAIEHDYGEWVVAGDRKVREGEWSKMAKIRMEQEEEARRKAEEAAKIKAEQEARAEEAESRRLVAEKRAQESEAARLKAEIDAQNALAEAERHHKLFLLKAEEDAAEQARKKFAEIERTRLEVENARRLEEEAIRSAEKRRLQEDAARLQAESLAADAELAKQQAVEAEALRLHKDKMAQEEAWRLESVAIAAATELARLKSEGAETLRFRLETEEQEASAESARIDNERQLQETQASQVQEEMKAQQIAEENSRLAKERKIQEAEVERVRQEKDAEPVATAKLERDRSDQEAEEVHMRELALVTAAKIEEERQIQESKRARDEIKAQEEMDLQEAERLEKGRELLAKQLEEQKLQEIEAIRLSEEKKTRDAAEAKRLEEEQQVQHEAVSSREASEARSASSKLEEERKLQDAEFARLGAEKISRDLAAASLKAKQDVERATLAKNQIQEAKEAEAKVTRQVAQENVRDVEMLKQEAKMEAQEAEQLVAMNQRATEEPNAKNQSDDFRRAEVHAALQGDEQAAQHAETTRMTQKVKTKKARVKAEGNELESTRLHALQQQFVQNDETSRLKSEAGTVKTARVRLEPDANEGARLESERSKLGVAQQKTIRDARDSELKVNELQRTLTNTEAEETRLRAYKAAEHERAEVARVRSVLEANSATRQTQRKQQSSDSISESTSLKSTPSSLARADTFSVSQSSGLDHSRPEHYESIVDHPTQHPTFDGCYDLDEPVPHYEGRNHSSYQNSTIKLNPIESSYVPHIPQTNISERPSHASYTSNSDDVTPIKEAKSSVRNINNEPVFEFSNGVFFKQRHPEDKAQKPVVSSTSTKSAIQPINSANSHPIPSMETELSSVHKTRRSTSGDFSIKYAPIQDHNASDSVPKPGQVSPLPTGYSASDPTPEIFDAEPTSYFRPLISPVKSTRSSVAYSEPTTPTSSPSFSDLMAARISPTFEKPALPKKSPRRFAFQQGPSYSPIKMSPRHTDGTIDSFDGSAESVPSKDLDMELDIFAPHSLARKTSITRINSPSPISISRRDSASSNGSTVINSPLKDAPASPIRRVPSPMRPSTPTSPRNTDSFQEDDLSPSIRRHRNGSSHDYTSPDSPPPIPDLSKHSPISHKRMDSFSSLSKSSDSPTTPTFTIDPSPVPITSPKKASSDDQMQKQISNLLESIPARIRLTTESDVAPADTLNVKKTRRSMTPNIRSSSSMSSYSRAPTPSFTLAPAQGPPRQRAQNGNPEIKVYHLSRSTGEAPIKLFVRLVGENGERVMVRVGGGWADLGEYLKEYASHHGRRAAIGEDDKVEIQDLPPRIVSTGSSSSTATLRSSSNATLRSSLSITNLRSNGRASPVSRPGSAMSFNRPASALGRPMSSLTIRKTRKSTGDNLDLPLPANTFRSPSTPMPSTLSRTPISYETPPSSSSTVYNPPSTERERDRERSSSRLSWAEEDSSLGLAGPKSKKIAISEKDQEWVQSMKEKVRQASAEKERKARGASFGEMDRIGGTKRLFRKKGL